MPWRQTLLISPPDNVSDCNTVNMFPKQNARILVKHFLKNENLLQRNINANYITNLSDIVTREQDFPSRTLLVILTRARSFLKKKYLNRI